MVGQAARWRRRAVVCASLLIAIVDSGVTRAADLASSEWPTKGWTLATPEAEGLDAGALAEVVDWAKAERVDSLLVVRHGKIVLDAYFAPFKAGIRHDLFSITKGVIGTLTAIAIRDHLLDSVDHSVLDFFPDKTVAQVDDRKKAITVRNLLDMTSGFEWDRGGGPTGSSWAMHHSPDPTKFVLDQPMTSEPGQSFYYNNGNPYILSALITKLAEQNALEYAKKVLFGPLGISDVDWQKPDAQNVVNGESHLFLLPEDIAKLGYLYLHKGEWDGKQIIPASWVERARLGVIDVGYGGFRYANLWWSQPDYKLYAGQGSHGQVLVVLPDEDIVTVLTGAVSDRDTYISPVDLGDYIAKCVRADKDLPPDPKGVLRLNSALQSATMQRSDAVEETSPLAQEISGKVYDLEDNPLRWKSFSLNLVGARPNWSGSRQKSTTDKSVVNVSRAISLSGLFLDSQADEGAPLLKGRWLNTTSFEVQSRALGYGVTDKWIFEFRGASVDIHFENNEGFVAELHGTTRQ